MSLASPAPVELLRRPFAPTPMQIKAYSVDKGRFYKLNVKEGDLPRLSLEHLSRSLRAALRLGERPICYYLNSAPLQAADRATLRLMVRQMREGVFGDQVFAFQVVGGLPPPTDAGLPPPARPQPRAALVRPPAPTQTQARTPVVAPPPRLSGSSAEVVEALTSPEPPALTYSQRLDRLVDAEQERINQINQSAATAAGDERFWRIVESIY